MLVTPYTSKLVPWHIACARRSFVTWATLPAIWTEAFFSTWAQIYREGGK